MWQAVKKAFVVGERARTQVDIESMKLSIAEAKDLAFRGKAGDATDVLRSVQSTLSDVSEEKTTKKDAQTQETLGSISETRFQAFADVLKVTNDQARNKLIKEIAQQAEAMV